MVTSETSKGSFADGIEEYVLDTIDFTMLRVFETSMGLLLRTEGQVAEMNDICKQRIMDSNRGAMRSIPF
jgi:hypothetical protein